MTCRCGHGPDVHVHDRAGSDCGVCGCASYLTDAARRWLITGVALTVVLGVVLVTAIVATIV